MQRSSGVTQPIRYRSHSETYSTFGQRTDVNFACKSSRLRATTEHPPEIASPPQRTIDHDRAPAISFLPAALVSARPPRSIPSCASSPPKTPACRDGAYRASVRICFAASTMLTSAGRTSVHFRVLRPQSGLTQIWSGERCSLALLRRLAISPTAGTRGEWMS